MERMPLSVLLRVGVGAAALALSLVSPGPSLEAQAPLIFTSVNGALERVDTQRGGIILKMDNGKRQAWLFPPRVLTEVARFKPGTRMWVIYRQLGPSERAVTALGFPGAATKPVYLNATGSRVLLRTAAAVEGKCGEPSAAPATELALPAGSSTEDTAACWCCASPGKTCPPANKSGAGRIVLTGCFP